MFEKDNVLQDDVVKIKGSNHDGKSGISLDKEPT